MFFHSFVISLSAFLSWVQISEMSSMTSAAGGDGVLTFMGGSLVLWSLLVWMGKPDLLIGLMTTDLSLVPPLRQGCRTYDGKKLSFSPFSEDSIPFPADLSPSQPLSIFALWTPSGKRASLTSPQAQVGTRRAAQDRGCEESWALGVNFFPEVKCETEQYFTVIYFCQIYV